MNHDDINALLRQRSQTADAPVEVTVPPPCFVDMQGEFIAYDEGVSLTARFPVLERYQNPLGYMQGGYIVAAMDNTLGPFSWLVAPLSVTTQLNTSYIRPVTPETAYIDITARITERTRRMLFLTAQAKNPEGKPLALANCTCSILTA